VFSQQLSIFFKPTRLELENTSGFGKIRQINRCFAYESKENFKYLLGKLDKVNMYVKTISGSIKRTEEN
jgi:hypothetical protein